MGGLCVLLCGPGSTIVHLLNNKPSMINKHKTEYVGEEEPAPEPGSQIALAIMKSQPRDSLKHQLTKLSFTAKASGFERIPLDSYLLSLKHVN